MNSYKAKCVILANLGAFFRGFGPLLGPWGRNEFLRNNFLQCTTRYENTTCCKISEKLMDGYRALVRTHGRTHGRTDVTENNGPSPINRGTN